jgi:hypothetical protein
MIIQKVPAAPLGGYKMGQSRRRPLSSHNVVVGLAVTGLLVALAAPAGALPALRPQATAGANGRVDALVQVGDVVYLGGEFTAVGGEPRSRLAAIDVSTGSVTSWNPGADGNVYALLAGPDGSVYAGGAFKTVGGATHKGIVKFDGATGNVDATWRPKATGGAVRSLALGNGQLYVGGAFTKLQDAIRNRVGAIDPVTGALRAWDPNANGAVEAFAIASDGTVFVGGSFTSIADHPRSYIARVDGTTGGWLSWPTGIGYPVREMVVADATLYVAGAGTGGTVGAYSAATGDSLWARRTTGDVQGIDVSSSTVYAGGHFNYVEGVFRRKIAAFDIATGDLLGWNPATNGPYGVAVIKVTPDALLVGGEFTKAGGAAQSGFARFVGTP